MINPRGKSKLVLVLAALLIVGLIVTACSKPKKTEGEPAGDGQAQVEQVISYNLGTEPETLDSAKASGAPEFTTMYNLFEGLARLNPDYSPAYGVAEDWEISADGTVYTFHLRKDAKWSNGDPVTAEDFVYAWQRVLNPLTAADYAYQLYYIKGAADLNGVALIVQGTDGKDVDRPAAEVEADIAQAAANLGVKAKDPYTLEVTLDAPAPQFLQLMAFPTFFPVHKASVEAQGETYGGEAEGLVSNGPFKLDKWEHRSVLEMTPSDNYWDKANVKPEKLVFYTVEESSTELTMWETGEIDLGDNPPIEEMDRLIKENKLTIGPDLSVYYYVFNTEKKPFDDLKVRRAFTLAVDRQALVDFLQGGRKPARAYVPYGITNPETGNDFRTEEAEHFFQDDLAEAKRLLGEAGYPEGKGLPKIEILYNTSEGHKSIAEFIQQQWATNLGIPAENIVPYNQEWQVYLDARDAGNYQVARAGWGADYIDPMTFLDMYMANSGNNDTNWSDAEYDRLLQEAKATGDQKTRFANMHKAEKILMDALPVLPLYFYTDLYTISPKLKGALQFPFGPDWDFKAAYKEP